VRKQPGNLNFWELAASLQPWQWALAAIAMIVSGVSKAGLKGIAIVVVTLFALVFGSRASTGILLPMLIVADVFAVIYYHRHAQVKYLIKVLPWILLGVVLGAVFGKDLNEVLFKQAMAVIIVVSLLLMYLLERRKAQTVPDHWTFAGIMGLIAGVATMVGNLAGAFTTLYFLALRLPKDNFIGTAAWLFLIINLFKVPFHVFLWETITWQTLTVNLTLIPPVVLGFFIGVLLIKRIKDHHYRKLIIGLTALGALAILLR